MKATRSSLLLLGLLTASALAKEAAPAESQAAPAVVEAPADTTPAEAAPAPAETSADSKPEEKPAESTAPSQNERERLSAENALAEERLKAETSALRAEITRLKMEKELLSEKLSLEALKRQEAQQENVIRLEEEKAKLSVDAELAKTRAEYFANELKAVQAEASIEVTRLQNEISRIEMEEKRKAYADAKPQYLENPLKEDGTLVISDRRIPLNGPITMDTADYVTSRIDFFNNANRKYPIFIVIDYSPGGSVMAGYRILKAMESSDAPVHVVVKSFAASMAAGITTLAKESYAYPNAIILHHQISNTLYGQLNLTQQAEVVKESQRWWTRLAKPVADKMGITTDEFIKRMYEHSSSGDWSEFGEQAKELKWVNHIVHGIEETSFTQNPNAKRSPAPQQAHASLKEEVDANGKPFSYLPRLMPKDVYFLYNPDGYYRLR